MGPGLPLGWHAPARQGSKAPRLVFLPGIASDSRSWVRQSPLAERWPVAFLDLPLDVPGAPYSFDTLALLAMDAVRQICDRPPILVGTSFGGMTALTCAVTWPAHIEGLILTSTTCEVRWFRGYRYIERLVRRTMPLIPDRLFTQAFPYLCQASGRLDGQDIEACRMMADEARTFNRHQYGQRLHAVSGLHLSDRLGEVTMPTLYLHGTEDRTIPVRLGLKMAERLPNATVHVLEGGGHSFYLRHAHWLNTHIRTWLESKGLD
ncbi:MAG TPA: alpha/beta hydrolase [Candidatus Xenobia bacterium]